MSYKLKRGIHEVKFNDIYDEWIKILREFVKNMMSGNNVSKMLLEELLSFRTEELVFPYECLGFTHQDIDMIFDWLRITPDERFMGGLDKIDGDVIVKSP